MLSIVSLSKVRKIARIAELEDIGRLGCVLTESLVHLLEGFLGRKDSIVILVVQGPVSRLAHLKLFYLELRCELLLLVIFRTKHHEMIKTVS